MALPAEAALPHPVLEQQYADAGDEWVDLGAAADREAVVADGVSTTADPD